MAFNIDVMKRELTELDEKQFYIKYIVKTMNWYFSTYMDFDDATMLETLDHFKEIVSEKLSVSFHSAHIVGSAKVGYSLSPRKPFKPFHEEERGRPSSDIDVAIISDYLFNMFWQKLRARYKTQLIANYERLTSTIFQGYINEKDITAIYGVAQEWTNMFSPITKTLQDELNIIHPITYRVYRSWEDLEQYQISGLNKQKNIWRDNGMFIFKSNNRDIKGIHTMFNDGSLIIDTTYQRRSVWGERDRIRLIETVLLNLVIPELFFWKASTDPETGKSVTHIVDGQQRLNAIIDFIDGKFKLKEAHLLEKDTKSKWANKTFSQFAPEEKTTIWNYPFVIIEIDPAASRDDIVRMFRRLNLTDYNLNDQERRNSMHGEFAVLARELSENAFWEKHRLFNATNIKRMKDVEFCATMILLCRNGIIDQTDQKALNQAYEELQENYTSAEQDKDMIITAISIADSFIRQLYRRGYKKILAAQSTTIHLVFSYLLFDTGGKAFER